MDPSNPLVPLDLAIALSIVALGLGVLLGIILMSRSPAWVIDADVADALVDDYVAALRDLSERDAPRIVEPSPDIRERLRRQEAARDFYPTPDWAARAIGCDVDDVRS